MDLINICIIFAQNCIPVLFKSLLYLLTGTMQLFLLLPVDDVVMRVDNM